MQAKMIGVTSVSIAIVFVMVRFIQVPIVATGGFTHAGAVAEIFVSLAFGPMVGLVASGVGAALADLTSGYAHFAPLTLPAHAALGLLAGYLGWKHGWGRMLAGWIAGGLALVAVYFAGESLVVGVYGGVARALGELGFNLFQVGLGIFGLLLFRLVKRGYPEIERLAEPATFEEVS
ncbi:MAG TPA: ECF transporter S component [Anaerolineales bacterium]|jgi:uncharacterized membrane protein|nr:ECF transporter S component [Anaerolineales bacterium]